MKNIHREIYIEMSILISKVKHSILVPICLGILCVLLTSLPLFHDGFFRPHDFTHTARLVEMYRSLQFGEFPVRWSANFGFGYGMPLFNFYAPLPYYIALIPYILSHDAILAIKSIYLLNAVLAFAGMYLYGKRIWGREGGAICAIVFTFSTYRALDLYVRGALGEASAMVLIPFALYSVERLKEHPKQGSLFLLISLSTILLSHNLIGMVFIGFICLYMAIRLDKNLRIYGVASLLGALSLSAFYILPAFVEKNFTRVEQTITTGYFDYHLHFVALRQFVFGRWGYGGSLPGLDDGISFALGILPLCLLGISIVACVRYKKHLGIVSLALLLFFSSLFMASNRSLMLWENVTLLKYMQFPWRFLTFSHVFLALCCGGVVLLFSKKNVSLIPTLVVGIVCILFVGFQSQFFQPERYIQDTDPYYSTDPAFIQQEMSKTLNDYLPKEIEGDKYPPMVNTRVALHEGSGNISQLSQGSSAIDFHAFCTGTCVLDIFIFQFPGWSAVVDGAPQELAPTGAYSTYQLVIPDGDHAISLRLNNTLIRTIGNSLSLFTLIGILCLLGNHYVTHRSPRRS